ncbi:MAG: alpha/beta hydrolase [Dehalococcoidia bacterium]|jgi:hypothetical protein|nr:alpha/beta hydrolase [Dehalococcoidia bacterium]
MVATAIILVLVVLAVKLWTQPEQRFIFFPSSDIVSTPDQVGLAYEDVFFTTRDGLRLHAWFVPGATDITLLWFHGNGGNISHRIDELAVFHHRLGANLMIIDYRGYGRSEGRPSEQGTYRDARAALLYLEGRPGASPERIVYFGRSLGSAVAVELAVAHPPLALVLVSPFASIGDMARIAFPRLPIRWLVRNKYNTLARVAKVQRPLLILHGDQDETVPISQGEKLFEAANPPKRFQILSGMGHNDSLGGETELWEALEEFLAESQAG